MIGTAEKFISLKLKERLISNKQVAVKEKWYLSNNFLSIWKNLKEEGWGECSLVHYPVMQFVSFAIIEWLEQYFSAHQDNLKSSIQTFTGISTRIAGFVLFIFKKHCCGFKRSWIVICDWWISIRFVCFCVSSEVCSLWLKLIMIDNREKHICEGSFWA